MNFDQLNAQLWTDEGFEPYPYDDTTGQRLLAGDVVGGTITIGAGFTYLSEEEAKAVLAIRTQSVAAQLIARMPWVSALSDARQQALTNMAYNLGIAGLSGFVSFLTEMKNGQFDQAADDLMKTKWAGQVGARCSRVAEAIRKG